MRDLYTWSFIFLVVISSTAGDILQSHAMKVIGDVGQLRRARGLGYVIRRVVTSPSFMMGLFFMAMAFFSLMIALSWGDVSLVVPASASLTFITNAFAAKIFLHENVDRRRMFAAVLVAAGVALLSF
ncbi:MAG TPA: EamA family transporter [Candidatus Koribacter sp.]|jgi:drug/metabolite transporter (DMT)-like permease